MIGTSLSALALLLAPHAVFEKTLVDAGSLAPGAEANVEFKLSNTGDEVLHVLEAKPG